MVAADPAPLLTNFDNVTRKSDPLSFREPDHSFLGRANEKENQIYQNNYQNMLLKGVKFLVNRLKYIILANSN
ncbi:MAG TPA: hypothetical protein DCR43_03555 [Bacteroidales bacterium]|nr:MAG: hypothetical protein A2X11_00305 [Bacteroidetes bacterium GWE2_42_24]OFY27757.1 MAG: hypothetical protein A2X09_02595 [Bacteroidetes bacterium GWF2_43_11]PKP21919.1 MAG: hypothetical protein CVU06_09820 [Bacteroidetes bacterium HGW-Bacteroidetes-22]HAQ64919.1 hypothetical protein [Bacteroidales bacterium]HBZ66115.1 hypothetical protein [Bacteroidales bacterium]